MERTEEICRAEPGPAGREAGGGAGGQGGPHHHTITPNVQVLGECGEVVEHLTTLLDTQASAHLQLHDFFDLPCLNVM